jgi:hypothetical protein
LQGLGTAPSSPFAEGEIISLFNFAQRNMFFFAAILPKRTERITSMYKNKGATYQGNPLVCLCEKFVFVLFLGYVAARKRTKKNGE